MQKSNIKVQGMKGVGERVKRAANKAKAAQIYEDEETESEVPQCCSCGIGLPGPPGPPGPDGQDGQLRVFYRRQPNTYFSIQLNLCAAAATVFKKKK